MRDRDSRWLYKLCAVVLLGIVLFLNTELKGAELRIPRGYATIGLMEARESREMIHSLFLDVRPELFYRSGHIRGAINLPLTKWAQSSNQLAELCNSSGIVRLVCYCSDKDCGDARDLALLVLKLPVNAKVFVFEGGWDEWSADGAPTEK